MYRTDCKDAYKVHGLKLLHVLIHPLQGSHNKCNILLGTQNHKRVRNKLKHSVISWKAEIMRRLTAAMVRVGGIVKLLHLIIIEHSHIPVGLLTQRQERRLVILRIRRCIRLLLGEMLGQDKAPVVVDVSGGVSGLELGFLNWVSSKMREKSLIVE